MGQIILFNKPFNVLSQFTDSDNRDTLKKFIPISGFYPAGRLDKDSEGLLILTNNGKLQHAISHPDKKMSKTYWAQVEGKPDSNAIQQLENGVLLKECLTKPAQCRPIETPSMLEDRNPPIRVRKNIPDSWIELTITEGKNRQVRRMCAKVGFPVLRLIRYQVGSWTLDGLKSGSYKVIG